MNDIYNKILHIYNKILNKMKKQIISEEFRKMQKIAGLINENVVNFDELKKHQEIIRKEQDYLLDITKKLNIDNKLVGDFNKSLNDLMTAIFEKNK